MKLTEKINVILESKKLSDYHIYVAKKNNTGGQYEYIIEILSNNEDGKEVVVASDSLSSSRGSAPTRKDAMKKARELRKKALDNKY